MKIEQSTISSVSEQLSRSESQRPHADRDDEAAYTEIRGRQRGLRPPISETLESISQLPVPVEILKQVQDHFLEDFTAGNANKDIYTELKNRVQIISTELQSDPESAKSAHSGLSVESADVILN